MTDMIDSNKIVKLTGKKISHEMAVVLYKLRNGADVPIEEIENTAEIKLARTCVNNSIQTAYLVGRDKMRNHIIDELMNRGSVQLCQGGEIEHKGVINNDSRLDIVIGLPASGKSSALVNTLSQEYGSRVIDCDEAKKMLPEYNDGWGSGTVHMESKIIESQMLKESLLMQNNIVLPKVGSDLRKMLKTITLAKEFGYKVYVHNVSLEKNIALGRMLNRFIEQGRFLDPKLIDKYCNSIDGNKIDNVYEILKKSDINGFSKWDNNVKIGERPKLLESNCEGRVFNHGNISNNRGINEAGRDGSLQGGKLYAGAQRGNEQAVKGGKHEEAGRSNAGRVKKHSRI